jgi:hypothetical protein
VFNIYAHIVKEKATFAKMLIKTIVEESRAKYNHNQINIKRFLNIKMITATKTSYQKKINILFTTIKLNYLT